MLINCPDCRRTVSDAASVCPVCGCPVNKKVFRRKASKNIVKVGKITFKIIPGFCWLIGAVFVGYFAYAWGTAVYKHSFKNRVSTMKEEREHFIQEAVKRHYSTKIRYLVRDLNHKMGDLWLEKDAQFLKKKVTESLEKLPAFVENLKQQEKDASKKSAGYYRPFRQFMLEHLAKKIRELDESNCVEDISITELKEEGKFSLKTRAMLQHMLNYDYPEENNRPEWIYLADASIDEMITSISETNGLDFSDINIDLLRADGKAYRKKIAHETFFCTPLGIPSVCFGLLSITFLCIAIRKFKNISLYQT